MPPNTTQPVEYQDGHGNLLTTFTSASVDMSFADQMFLKTTHKVKGISGANGNCWIRGTWLAAMTQHFNDQEGNGLTERLKEKLGPDFYDDAEKAGQMLRAFRDKGIQTIVTGQELANMDADFEKDSYLKLPGNNIDVDGSEGEAVCERLTYALLSKAGMSDAELAGCIASSQHGELHHVTTLMRELGGDTVVYGRRWEWDRNTAKASFNPAQSVITICAQPESRLKNLDIAPGTSATNALFQEMDVKPLLLHKGGHFEFCIPTICLHGRNNYRWPS